MRLLLLLTNPLLAALPAQADVWSFETPSGNIHCSVGEDVEGSDIICTIVTTTSSPAVPRPADCAQDWGHTFAMTDRGPVEILCAPTAPNHGAQHRAEYGVTGKFGGFTCTSSTKGLDCRNLDGHGFFLSRAVQQVF